MSGRVRRLLVGSFLSVVLLGTTALVFVAAPAGGTLALNHAMLDDGTCGQVLQLGSDITASRSSTPSFLLGGDGALSSYSMAIDGVSIGTFNSDQYSHVCVRDTIVFRDGAHQLTGKELKPNAANSVTAFSFTVDTVAPPAPYGLRLDVASDTGVIGDNVTTATNLRIDGFGTVGAPIHVLEGSLMRAGYGGQHERRLVGDHHLARQRHPHLYRGRARFGREPEPGVVAVDGHHRHDVVDDVHDQAGDNNHDNQARDDNHDNEARDDHHHDEAGDHDDDHGDHQADDNDDQTRRFGAVRAERERERPDAAGRPVAMVDAL